MLLYQAFTLQDAHVLLASEQQSVDIQARSCVKIISQGIHGMQEKSHTGIRGLAWRVSYIMKHINRARYVSLRQSVQGSVFRLVPGFMAPGMKRCSYLGMISLQRDSAVSHERCFAAVCSREAQTLVIETLTSLPMYLR